MSGGCWIKHKIFDVRKYEIEDKIETAQYTIEDITRQLVGLACITPKKYYEDLEGSRFSAAEYMANEVDDLVETLKEAVISHRELTLARDLDDDDVEWADD